MSNLYDLTVLSGPEVAPPQWAIDQAVAAALCSPCQKRRVGISVYELICNDTAIRSTAAGGFNGPPVEWSNDNHPLGDEICDGSEACRRDCAKRSVHAEMRAIDTLIDPLRDRGSSLRFVHVKLDDGGHIAPCIDGPSCVDCSKHILDAGIGGIWLYEPTSDGAPIASWRYYTASQFHAATCRTLGIYNPGEATT